MNIIDTYDLYKTRREIKKNAYAIMRLYISTIIIIMVIGRWHTSNMTAGMLPPININTKQ